MIGDKDGEALGIFDGETLGIFDGEKIDTFDGLKLGFMVGEPLNDVGELVLGKALGVLDSMTLGTVEGDAEDSSDGFDVGEVLGVVVGYRVGVDDGAELGDSITAMDPISAKDSSTAAISCIISTEFCSNASTNKLKNSTPCKRLPVRI